MNIEETIKKIWSNEGILEDRNNDHVIDHVSLYIELEKNYFPPSLIDLFARIGYETTALSYNFFEKNHQKYTLRFVESYETSIEMNCNEIILKYDSYKALNDLITKIARLNLIKAEGAVIPEIRSLSDIWSFSGFGFANEASPSRQLSLGINIEEHLLDHELGRTLCNFVARASLYSTEFLLPIAERDSSLIQMDIVEDSKQSIDLLSKNHMRIAGRSLGLVNMIDNLSKLKHWSEGGVFGEWERKLKQNQQPEEVLLQKSWEGTSEVEKIERILDSYKNEVQSFTIYTSRSLKVRKELKTYWERKYNCTIKDVFSTFKTAYHWFEEVLLINQNSEKIERIEIRVRKDQQQGLELPIRWIQEIYPVDLLIEEKWGIPKEFVTFTCCEDLENTYVVVGKSDSSEKVLGTLNVPTMKIDYVEKGKYAYPSSSAVEIVMKDGTVKLIKVKSDRFAFYEYYLTEILPILKKEFKVYNHGQGHSRPFFDRIEIDVWMNEDERKLGYDEERISSLEALHEDLYFNTLDYFASWGEEVEGKPFYAPGGVYPFMHLSDDQQPKAEIKVYSWTDIPLAKVKTTRILANEAGELKSVLVEKNGTKVEFPIEKHYLNKTNIHPELQRFLHSKHHSRIVVPDYTYKGMQIPVIECFSPIHEEYIAPLKMTMQKKTIIIEAGHHSNEVSSTPAVIKLIQNLTEEVLNDVNIIVIPMANLDGYHLLRRLMEEHPEWKHHAARYNAVGLEYSYIRFHESVFGEGNILPELLRRWAADVIVDDHGIPAHEWVQPFAGYNSPPRFPVSYFLPSAKMYGIGKLPMNVDSALHKENFNAVFHVVNETFKNTKIDKLNAYWRSRYRKYGNDWLPDIFLIELEESLNFYKMEVESNANSYQAIGRYPEWIAADIITEAADEIVYDEILYDCIDAQYRFNWALIEQLRKSSSTFFDGSNKIRKRPIKLTDNI